MEVTTETRTLESYVPRMLLPRLAAPTSDLLEMRDGTMVFADVSGFTRLSERLARTGKEGAEHLVDAINACFSALLADAFALGGSLLKFGGDAMLLWFDGDGHVLRACAAAAAMRRTLRDVGRIRAGASDVVLRMSVGVHSGSYAMFLLGGSHRELLIGGAGTSEVVAMEGAASAGQILLSAQTAERLPPSCLGVGLGPGVEDTLGRGGDAIRGGRPGNRSDGGKPTERNRRKPSDSAQSGRRDSNPRPLDPQSSALTRLRYAPKGPCSDMHRTGQGPP